MIDLTGKKILLTGGGGFLGTHVASALFMRGARREDISIPRSAEYNLRRREDCAAAVAGQDLVIHLAAKVGGIGYNQQKPGELFYDNMIMGTHMLESAYRAGVQKILILGTVCAYPKFTPVPFREEELWNGYPEETNAPYGLAKKSLLTASVAYRKQYGLNSIFLLPVNLYGPGDNFDENKSHVLPALIKKVADAQANGTGFIEVWGTGRATREFLYVEDAAEGIVRALTLYDSPAPVNLGSGMEISIRELLAIICRLMNFTGEIRWDEAKPDGQPRRRLDISRAETEFGFRAQTNFEDGLQRTIKWYLAARSKPQA